MDEEEERLQRAGDREELTAYLDKKYSRMEESDEEGVGLHPADPRHWFIMTCEGVIFIKASPLTEEDLAELARMKKMLNIEDDKNTQKRDIYKTKDERKKCKRREE